MSIASPTYLGLATGSNCRKAAGESSMSGKGGEQQNDLAMLPSLQTANGQACIGLTVDLSESRYIGDAGSLRRHLGGWDRDVRTLIHLTPPAPTRRGWQRVEHGTFPRCTCMTGNTGSPKLVDATSPIWRRSSHSIQCGSVMGLAAGIQSGPRQRHKLTAMSVKPGEVGEKGSSSWCGLTLPEGG